MIMISDYGNYKADRLPALLTPGLDYANNRSMTSVCTALVFPALIILLNLRRGGRISAIPHLTLKEQDLTVYEQMIPCWGKGY